ncbi:MAG: CBS domain-containing protein [bacterium]
MRPRIDPASFTPFHEALYDLSVQDAMVTNLIVLNPDATMLEAQHLMRDHRISGIPIVKDEHLVGLVSIQDVIEALVANDINAPVRRWMTGKVITVREKLPLIQAVKELQTRGYGRLPVLNKENRLIGLLTSNDVTRAVMLRLNEEAKAAEQREAKLLARSLHESEEKPGVETITASIKAMDLDSAGTFASLLKKALKERRVDPEVARRAAIAAYEAEVNVILHSMGGILEAFLTDRDVTILVRDRGPGIADVELAMQEGYSTANEVVRALGFGAGMGLPNMRRCSDEFSIKAPASGTTVTMKIYFSISDQKDTAEVRL